MVQTRLHFYVFFFYSCIFPNWTHQMIYLYPEHLAYSSISTMYICLKIVEEHRSSKVTGSLWRQQELYDRTVHAQEFKVSGDTT